MKIFRKWSFCRKHKTHYRAAQGCPYCKYEQLGLKVGIVELG